jgi:signal transduction histidine kinase
MLSYAAQGRFAAEFATFLVATAGLALVGLRAELLTRSWWSRLLFVAGFGALAAATFLQGSLITKDQTSVVDAVVQAAGIVAIAVGAIDWAGGRVLREVLWTGLVLMAGAIALVQSHNGSAGDVALGTGAVFVGGALLAASRRSVAARVAASSAGTLLVVVLVLSVALSTVLSRNIQQNVTHRVDVQAAGETSLIEQAGQTNALVMARSASLVLSASPLAVGDLTALSAAAHPQLDAKLSSILAVLRGNLLQEASLLYVNQSGAILAASQASNVDQATLAGVVGSEPVQQAIRRGPITSASERGSVETVGTVAAAVGVEPVSLRDTNTGLLLYPGVLIALQPLDNAYLSVRAQLEKIGLSLVSRSTVLAQAGATVDPARVIPLAGAALDSTSPLSPRRLGDRFYSAQVVRAGDGRPVMALIASTPITDVTDTQNALFRTLFEIALGGTLLALLLAAIVGERIGAGLRTLTQAARRIQRGDYSEPSGVRTDDEVGVLGTAFDSMATSIFEQTAALQKAAEDETALRNQLQAVVAGMGEALVAIDGSGRVTLINRAGEELLDVDAQWAVGRHVEEVITATPDDGSDLVSRLRRPSPGRWSTTITLQSTGRKPVPAAISSGALRGPTGGMAGAVFVLRDLRPEREVERMKSEFLSRIGHELRTPLTAILGYAEILLRRRITQPRAGQFHDEIYQAAQRLSRIVEMLEFSAAAEAGHTLMRPEQTSVKSVVDQVVNGWQERVNGNFALSRRVARGLPEIHADRRWLTLSLNELIDNAVKFSPNGGRVSIVADRAQFDGRDAVSISVLDEGLGVTDADLERMFVDFAQGDASDTRRFGGLGLGLSLVRRVAEAHGGTVSVSSEPRKGSKFSIVLPV